MPPINGYPQSLPDPGGVFTPSPVPRHPKAGAVEAAFESLRSLLQDVTNEASFLREILRIKGAAIDVVTQDLERHIRKTTEFFHRIIPSLDPRRSRELYDHLDILLKSSLRMKQLLADLVEFSQVMPKDGRLKMASVDYGPFARAELAAMDTVARASGIRLEADIPLGSLPTRIHLEHIRYVWQNLMHRAIRASPRRAAIRVRLEANDGHVDTSFEDSAPALHLDDAGRLATMRSGARSLTSETFEVSIPMPLIQTILELHGTYLQLQPLSPAGNRYRFSLPLFPR